MTCNYQPPKRHGVRGLLNRLFGRISPYCNPVLEKRRKYWAQFLKDNTSTVFRPADRVGYIKTDEQKNTEKLDLANREVLEIGGGFEADQQIELHGYVELGQYTVTVTLVYTIPGKLALNIDHPDINTTKVGVLCSEDAFGKIQIICKQGFEKLTEHDTGQTVYQAFRPDVLVKIPQMIGPKVVIEKLSDVANIANKLTTGALTIVQPVITSLGVSVTADTFVCCRDVQMAAVSLEGVIANIAPVRTHAYIRKEYFDEYVRRVQAQTGKPSV